MRQMGPTKADGRCRGEILAEPDLLRSPKPVAAVKIYERLLTASLLRLDLIGSLVGRGPDKDEVLSSPSGVCG